MNVLKSILAEYDIVTHTKHYTFAQQIYLAQLIKT